MATKSEIIDALMRGEALGDDWRQRSRPASYNDMSSLLARTAAEATIDREPVPHGPTMSPMTGPDHPDRIWEAITSVDHAAGPRAIAEMTLPHVMSEIPPGFADESQWDFGQQPFKAQTPGERMAAELTMAAPYVAAGSLLAPTVPLAALGFGSGMAATAVGQKAREGGLGELFALGGDVATDLAISGVLGGPAGLGRAAARQTAETAAETAAKKAARAIAPDIVSESRVRRAAEGLPSRSIFDERSPKSAESVSHLRDKRAALIERGFPARMFLGPEPVEVVGIISGGRKDARLLEPTLENLNLKGSQVRIRTSNGESAIALVDQLEFAHTPRAIDAPAATEVGGLSQTLNGVPMVPRVGLRQLAPNASQAPLEDRISKFLTQDEQASLTPNDRIRIDDYLQLSASPNEIAAMAAAGAAKKGWYRASAQAITEIFGDDAGRFASLLAATSPQTSVESNLRNALNIWKNWTRAGRPEDIGTIKRIMAESVEGDKGSDSVMDAWVNNTVRSFTKPASELNISGPKVSSFYLNLRGHMNEITQDTHMSRGLGFRQEDFGGRRLVRDTDEIGKVATKNSGYLAANLLVREAADVLKRTTGEVWSPAEIQETVWSWVKAFTDRAKKSTELSIPDILKSGAIGNDTIIETPDFATLFGGQNEFHTILRESGYGEQIQRLKASDWGHGGGTDLGPGSGFGAGESAGVRPPVSRALESAAQRLDRATRARGAGTGEDLRQLNQRTGGVVRSSRSAGSQPGSFRRRSVRAGVDNVGGKPATQFYLPKKVQAKYKKLGVPTPPVNRIDSPALFHEKISSAKATNKFGASVYVYSPEEYAGMRTYLTADGSAGFAIKKDGDIVSVFNHRDGKHEGISPYLVALATSEGGTKLDAFNIGGGLPRIYGDSGFDVVKKDAWDPKFRPDDWDDELLGTPDVVYMELRKPAATVEVKSDDPHFDELFGKDFGGE